jgi:hypothetical protein
VTYHRAKLGRDSLRPVANPVQLLACAAHFSSNQARRSPALLCSTGNNFPCASTP